jgi:hypothetical protein
VTSVVASVYTSRYEPSGREAGGTLPRPEKIAQDLEVFDVELVTDQLAAIDDLATSNRGGPSPQNITLANFGTPIPEA